MGWLLKQFSGALAPYLIVGLLVALGGLTISTAWLHHSNGRLHEDMATEKASVATLEGANRSNQLAIGELRSANETWAALAQGQPERDAQAKAKQAALESALRAAQAALSRPLIKEAEEPYCAALLQMDIQRVCPVRAQRMRDQASRSTH